MNCPTFSQNPRTRGKNHHHHNIFGHCATEITQSKKQHHGGVLQRLLSFGTEQMLPKTKQTNKINTISTNLWHAMRGIKLLHDNAPARESKLAQEHLSKQSQSLYKSISPNRVEAGTRAPLPAKHSNFATPSLNTVPGSCTI